LLAARASRSLTPPLSWGHSADSRSRPQRPSRHIRDPGRAGSVSAERPSPGGPPTPVLSWLVAPVCPWHVQRTSPARSRPPRGVAVLASVDAPRTRRTFARLDKSIDVPNLIDIKKKSFVWLVELTGVGLEEKVY